MRQITVKSTAAIAFFALFTFSLNALGTDEYQPKAEREDTLQFDINNDIKTLQIDSYNGKIILLTGDEGSSRLIGTAETWAYGKSEEQAQKRLAKIMWKFTQHGNTLKLQLKGSHGGSNITALTVPAKWNLKLETGNGIIFIPDGFATIKAESSNGQINIDGGNHVVAETSNGRIDYFGSAYDFDLDSANGRINIELNGNWNGQGNASTANGSVSVICSGIIDARLSSSSSSGKSFVYGPTLSKNSGTGKLSVSTSNGNISITHAPNVKEL